jgi:hypothetical protein
VLAAAAWVAATAFWLEAFDTLLFFVWMASTTASTAEVQNAAATPKEVHKWMPSKRLYSAPLTWHGSALFNTFDMAWWLGFSQHLCFFHNLWQVTAGWSLSDAVWKPIRPLTLLFD